MSLFKSTVYDFDTCFYCWCDKAAECGLGQHFDTPQCKWFKFIYFCGINYPFMYISEELWHEANEPKPISTDEYRFPELANNASITSSKRDFIECLHNLMCTKLTLQRYLANYMNRTRDCDDNKIYDCNDALNLVHAGPNTCVRKGDETYDKVTKIYKCYKEHLSPDLANETAIVPWSPWEWSLLALLIVILLVLGILLGYWCWRRKKRKQEESIPVEPVPKKRVMQTSSVKPFINLPLTSIIPPDELVVDQDKRLGEGQFGFVCHGTFKDIPVAVKTTKPHMVANSMADMEKEFGMMATIGIHQNIVRFYGVEISQISRCIAFIVMELSPHGALIDHLRKIALKPEEKTQETSLLKIQLYWAEQIACAMIHLEQKKVLHGDLAARNVLLFDKNVVKITDFGFARNLGNYEEYQKKQGLMPWRWMALESLERRIFSFKSDVWAFGVTVWEIFTLGMVPYTQHESCTMEFLGAISSGDRLPKPQPMSEEGYRKLLECWSTLPEERPCFQELHEFFRMQQLNLMSTFGKFPSDYEVVMTPENTVEPEVDQDGYLKPKEIQVEDIIENRYILS